jgi:hypothetical protein
MGDSDELAPAALVDTSRSAADADKTSVAGGDTDKDK